MINISHIIWKIDNTISYVSIVLGWLDSKVTTKEGEWLRFTFESGWRNAGSGAPSYRRRSQLSSQQTKKELRDKMCQIAKEVVQHPSVSK